MSTSNNEETKKYCICNKESFGEMIECENKDCDIGWFHFGCVGLKEVPKVCRNTASRDVRIT